MANSGETNKANFGTVPGLGGVSTVNGSSGAVTVPVGGRLVGFQVLTGSGTYTPTAGATAAFVTAIGGGAGAGGTVLGLTATTGGVSAGAGAGSYCSKRITPLAASYAFACGAAGAGGAAGANDGVDGGDTTFAAVLTAPGGKKSLGQAVTTQAVVPGGLGGALATGGDVNNGGNCGDGVMRVTSNGRISGKGGSTPWGSGGGSQSLGTASAVGLAGTGFGAGGGGAYSADAATDRAGGAGSQGAILVWEYS